MSVRAQNRVWEGSRSKGGDLLLLLAIADHAHDDGDGAWPSQALLARKTRMSARAIRDATHRLEDLGELEVVRSKGGKGNTYRVVLEAMLPADSAGRPPADSAGRPPPGDAVVPVVPTNHQDQEPSAPRARNVMFDALAEFEGIDWRAGDRPTEPQARRIARALSLIRKADPLATGEDLEAVVAVARSRNWSSATSMAIASHYGSLRAEARRRGPVAATVFPDDLRPPISEELRGLMEPQEPSEFQLGVGDVG